MREKIDRERENLYDAYSKTLLKIEEKIINKNLNDAIDWINNLRMVRNSTKKIEEKKDIIFFEWKYLYNRVANYINDTLPKESKNKIELIE